jgi:membrane-bound lytic murein transglycosylase D
MHPMTRTIVASTCVFTASLAAGYAAMPSRGAEALIPQASGQSESAGAMPKPAEPGVPKARNDVSPLREGGESLELRSLRAAEDRMFGNKDTRTADRAPACGPYSDPTTCRGARDDDQWGRTLHEVPDRGGAALDSTDWLLGLRLPDFPIRASYRTEKYLRYLTQTASGRKSFRTWLKRSGSYRNLVSAALRDRGLPQDLHALVFIESGYSSTAVSPAGATGLWQLMPDTGRTYGLAIESGYDERRSAKRSTEVAVRHLGDLYQRFGAWDLAFAAYDMGYRGLLKRVTEFSTNDYWALADAEGGLPREAVLYVPKLHAVALVLRNLDRFGFDDMPLDPPIVTTDLEVPPGASLALVARAAGTSLAQLRLLNPELLSDRIPRRHNSLLSVHIPPTGLARAQAMLPRLLAESEEEDDGRDGQGGGYDSGRDDAPAPRRPRRDFYDSTSASRSDDSGSEGGEKTLFYRVTEGETLQSIARAFRIRPDAIVEDNHLDPMARLQMGMVLKLRVPASSLSRSGTGRARTGSESRDDDAKDSRQGRGSRDSMARSNGSGAF